MDLSNLKPGTREVPIINPGTGKKTGLVLELISTTDDKYRQGQHERVYSQDSIHGETPTYIKSKSNRVEAVACSCVGWVWGKDEDGNQSSFNGEQLEFTPDNVRKVLATNIIREQVERALNDVDAFFAKVATELCDYIKAKVRYDTADAEGETRRQRNARFGKESPEIREPGHAHYLISWFRDASGMRRWDSGFPTIITPTEWLAWAKMGGVDVAPAEWKILRRIDAVYVGAVIEEIQANQKRMADKEKQS